MRRASKPLTVLICLFTSVAVAGCGAAEAAASGGPQIQPLAEQISHSSGSELSPGGVQDGRLPLENDGYQSAEIQHFRTIGAQFLLDDERAYQLAAVVYAYRDYRNMLIFDSDFTSIADAPPELLVEIAASQSPHIDLYGDAFEYADPQSQPIKRFFDEQAADGRSISLISYGEDVRKTAQALFGEQFQLPAQGGISVCYDQTFDVYYLNAQGPSLATDYPVFTKIEDGPDGSLIAQAVILSYWNCFNQWVFPDGSWSSEENADIQSVKAYVTENISRLPSHIYTFLPTEGGKLEFSGFSKAA